MIFHWQDRYWPTLRAERGPWVGRGWRIQVGVVSRLSAVGDWSSQVGVLRLPLRWWSSGCGGSLSLGVGRLDELLTVPFLPRVYGFAPKKEENSINYCTCTCRILF